MLVAVKDLREIAHKGQYPWIDVLINGKADNESVDLINRDDYVATKLWSREDVVCALEEKGYTGCDSEVDDVINSGRLDSLGECIDGDWQIIYDAIRESMKNQIRFGRVEFHEMDNANYPVHFFFQYDLLEDEMEKFLKDLSLQEEDTLDGVELCLTMYSENDWKLEAVFNYEDREQKWVELSEVVRDVEAFKKVCLVANTKSSKEAYKVMCGLNKSCTR